MILYPAQSNTSPSYNYATNQISPSIIEQTRQTLQNIAAALSEAGAELSDVVRVRYILVDAKEFESIWPVLKEAFGESRPAATMIQAGLMNEEMRIEIEVLARRVGKGESKL